MVEECDWSKPLTQASCDPRNLPYGRMTATWCIEKPLILLLSILTPHHPKKKILDIRHCGSSGILHLPQLRHGSLVYGTRTENAGD